jgi:hypothetical protein
VVGAVLVVAGILSLINARIGGFALIGLALAGVVIVAYRML